MNTLPHWLRVTRTLALGTLSLASTLAACESRTTATATAMGTTTSPSENTTAQSTPPAEPVGPGTPPRSGDLCVPPANPTPTACPCVADGNGGYRIQCLTPIGGPMLPPELRSIA
ncbi:MAG: hypothetical protein Q8Q09_19430 [Deltaproteobacteria bacterium]|nr:hypothetical protein [Deltaproteobacteria bacterium]